MKSLLLRLFINHWPRKLISLILAMIIWLMMSRSMTVTKVIPNIPVRVTNLPPGKTIEGMQIDGRLNKRLTLSVTGFKSALDEISGRDLEIVLNAKDKPYEWIASIDKKSLLSLNPNFNIEKQILSVSSLELIIRESNLITERIPITVTYPIGEAPKGYQFLNIYPYQLSVGVTGAEETVRRLKNSELKLTFNLNDIRKEDLDKLQNDKSDELSFFVPDSWKKISLPLLSEMQVDIDDPQAKWLRIDFSRQDLLTVNFPIPVTIFFPLEHSKTLNPETYTLATNEFIAKKNGIKLFNAPLFAQGVSQLFLETVKDRIQMIVIASPKSEREALLWNVQFMDSHDLENRYVAKVISASRASAHDLPPHLSEDYLRNRFRNYMNQFRLYTPNHHKLSLKIELQANAISVTPQNYP